MSLSKKYRFVLIVTVLVVFLDQLTKYMIVKNLALHSRIVVIEGFLNIIHIRNPGIAFGLFKSFGSNYKLISLCCVSAIALFLIIFLIAQVKKGSRLETFSLSLILGGAVGNLIDRFRLGEVIDFVDVHWRAAYHWPAFNVADSAISVGIVLIIFCELTRIRKHGLKEDADT